MGGGHQAASLKPITPDILQSIFKMIPAEDQKNLPEDEDTPEKRAEKIWEFFGKEENGNRR